MSILDTFSLSGKTALVSGGEGLYGRQIVRVLAEDPAREPHVASHNREELEKVAAEHRAQGRKRKILKRERKSLRS